MFFNKTDLVSCKILEMLYCDFAEFSNFCFVHFQKRIVNCETRYVNSNNFHDQPGILAKFFILTFFCGHSFAEVGTNRKSVIVFVS